MCYQKCRYECFNGECSLESGAEPPIDAMCSINDLEAENAKLRELIHEIWDVMWACSEKRCAHRADRCYRVRGNLDDMKSDGDCWFETRMRELGIEVEE